MLNMTTGPATLEYLTLNEKPFLLQSGAYLPEVTIAYQTFGSLNSERTNTVFVAHALTGNTSCDEWWSGLIGDGKLINPKEHFIICANVLGSCYGSTGPLSIDPETTKPYGKNFPTVSIRDIARSQLLLLQSLGISSIDIAIGGSMGGMVLLELALLNKEAGSPIVIDNLVPIATGAEHSAWRLAFSSTIRKTIERVQELSPENGFVEGLRLARQFATITYRSSEEFNERFGRVRAEANDKFEIERYLEHQGDKIVERFSPNSYITLTKAMELFDITEGRKGARHDILSTLNMRTLLVGISSDILYTEDEIKALAALLPNCQYATLRAPYGHDSFLVADSDLANLVRDFLVQTRSQVIQNTLKEEVYA